MANNNDSEHRFKNEYTRVRRAWVEAALSGVRARLGVPASARDPADGGEAAAGSEIAGSDEAAHQAALLTPGRPQLYVAWSSSQRRSGT